MDWICDICNRPESEVGNLITGRTQTGRDYQICSGCIEKYKLVKKQEVEKIMKVLESGKIGDK